MPAMQSDNDSDRLITAIQACFADVQEKQDRQAEELHQIAEALKGKGPTDTKTAFWTAYKMLADEQDRELQQKYTTELDTSLIFAGLFSAVSSAFIIQIQPQVQRDHTPIIIFVAQALLYISLFSTLLAALLAVLGKQWLMHYAATGQKGTIESRGLERQRKLDGLRKWKFDTIMQMFPLLLQLALLLFSTALSVYLWSVHIPMAIIVISITAFSIVAYLSLVVSAIVFPDSPFQTPLVHFLAYMSKWVKKFVIRISVRPRRVIAYIWRRVSCHRFCRRRRHRHHRPPHISQSPTPFNDDFPKPSPEAPAVAWILDTSTDPDVILAAAEMSLDVQWPLDMDLIAQTTRLRDAFLACFNYYP
ncbi:hypothetical protein C8R44DRAFT_868951 [Mycena epipterygia]|nr:hypothetical protein C8R44DRAFT_868951 [Mycena epipterygia]